jgi:hypothetical protein
MSERADRLTNAGITIQGLLHPLVIGNVGAASIVVDLLFPRHRGDRRLAELRRQILGFLGLDVTSRTCSQL